MTGAVRVALLSLEALRDAIRSGVGVFAVVGAILVAVFAERCTLGESGVLVVNGRVIGMEEGARLLGPVVYGVSAFCFVLIAGFVACDGLARPLGDGSALLWLARPVTRTAYALSRLLGALALAVGVGAVVLVGIAGLLDARLGLAMGPALWGLAACALDAWVVAAVAMALGLWLPRVVALAIVTIWTQLVVFSNGVHLVMDTGGGTLAAIERFGPPLGTAVLHALAPWYSSLPVGPDAAWVALRLVAWGAGATLVMVLAFRRMEVS